MPIAHLGRALVRIPLQQPEDCPAYRKMATRLTGGCQLFEPEIRTCRGEVIVTDPGGALRGALQRGLPGTEWLNCGLWLSDHEAGPSFQIESQNAPCGESKDITAWFLAALSGALVRRMNTGAGWSDDHRSALPFQMHLSWQRFLDGHEADFPGIVFALQSLPASLEFGLQKVFPARATGQAEAADFPLKVLCFAHMLVERMANARALMMRDGHRARLEALAAAVRRKLADGPLTVRELVRKSHRLQASDCEEALEILLLRGDVQRTGSAWALRQTPVQTEPLTLNV